MSTYFTSVDSPIQPLLLTSDGVHLTGVFMTPHTHGPTVGDDWIEDGEIAVLVAARDQLRAYFAGERLEFDLPLKPHGSPFQALVWQELTRIPYGTTISYGELARRIGNPNASRAVGLANGRNPISIIVPCHRVIGANGTLTGYGGGIERKAALLEFERSISANSMLPFDGWPR